MPIKSLIRTIPDYPKPGIQFRDITTLLQDAEGFRISVDRLSEPFLGERVAKVAGIEARGLMLGGAVRRRSVRLDLRRRAPFVEASSVLRDHYRRVLDRRSPR